MNDLYDIGRKEYRLFDNSRMRFLPVRTRLNEREVAAGDDYFARSLCPNLKWRLPPSSGEIIQAETEGSPRVRAYIVKR